MAEECYEEILETLHAILRKSDEISEKVCRNGKNNENVVRKGKACNNPTVIERMKDLASAAGMNSERISNGIGVPMSTYSAWITGRLGMPMDGLISFADFFGVSLDYLTGRSKNPEGEREAILENLRKASRESYRLYLKEKSKKSYVDNGKTYEAPWPYNLLDELYRPYEKEAPDDIEDRVLKALDTLSPREKGAILSYFKDDGTLDTVSREYNVTKERVRQILAKGIRKLRHPSRLKLIEYSEEELALKKEISEERVKLENMLAELREKTESIQAAGADPEGKRAEQWIDEAQADGVALEELEWSIRTYTCLKRANINTVGDLEMLIRQSGTKGLIRIRNLGRKSIEEILWRLTEVTGKDWERVAESVDKEIARARYGCITAQN